MATIELREDNCGKSRFLVNGTAFEVRHSTAADSKGIFALLNGEAVGNTVYQIATELNEYFKDKNLEDVKAVDFTRMLMKAYMPNKLDNKKGVEEPFIDYENFVRIAEQLKTGLSFITVAQKGEHSEIAGHMWAVDLSKEDMPGIVEITAGVVAPDYRDAGKHTTQRLNIQNRNRFALLNEIASRYPDETLIVSISRQSLVARPLEASGFVEMSEERASDVLKETVWCPPWIARYTTVGQWKALVDEKGIDTPEKYNQLISGYIRFCKDNPELAELQRLATIDKGIAELLRGQRG